MWPKNRLIFKEFTDLIELNDIFVCIESKLDDLDQLNLPKGYDYFTKNRKKFERKSGGITVIFKKCLKNFLTFINTDSEFVLWVKVDIPMQLTKIMFGCIYVPPENSRYSSKDAFDEIETELITLKDQSTATALLGDFNARTGSLCDYIIPDDELSKILNYDGIDEIDRCLYDYYNLCLYNVSLQRSSEDKGRINVYGNKLLQLCKNNCLYIANGRIGNDKNMGKVTSKETSLVDYLIVSGDLFPYITEFEVIDFDSLFSDIHCRLQFNLSAMLPDDLLDKNNSPNVPSKHIRWIGDKRDQFVDSVESKLTIDNLSNQ
ncbi:unnamed protein product [Mytilus edulis]|uniref:Endonuclease/exonuclease/phosphatase domain-containing protein n=1 Tax=Mytilus edulis TaxID=6550 RepID=A0A8S3R149_MYTED|nr:unnamed protein product [Mytilus edulis]